MDDITFSYHHGNLFNLKYFSQLTLDQSHWKCTEGIKIDVAFQFQFEFTPDLVSGDLTCLHYFLWVLLIIVYQILCEYQNVSSEQKCWEFYVFQ